MTSTSASTKSSGLRLRPRHVVLGVMLFAIAWIGAYLYATHSDAFEYAENFAKTNPEVERQIGHVSAVDLKPWEGFDVSSSEARFVLAVKGERANSVLDVRLKRVGEAWRAEEASLTTADRRSVRLAPPPKTP